MDDEAVIASFNRGTSTDKTYTYRLKAARSKFAQGRFGLNAANPLVDILTRPGALTYAQLREVYPQVTSRKNFITTLLVAYTRLPELATSGTGAAKVQEFWKDAHDTADMAVRILGSDNMPSEAQVAAYTSMADIKAKYKELAAVARTTWTLTDWMEYLLLSFCATGHRPKRNDLGAMRIYQDPPGGDPMLRDQNYVVLSTAGGGSAYFVYTKYKTAKTHSRVEEMMSDAMVRDLAASLRAHPREHLFVNRFGKPYTSNDTYGKFVRRTFENLFGKAMGTTMWRHVYISEALDLHEMSMAERQAEARLMMHTPALQERYNFGRASMCAALCPCPETAATTPASKKRARKRGA